VIRKFVGGVGGKEFVRIEVHANTECSLNSSHWRRRREGKRRGKPASGRFLRPSLVGVVEVGFAVVGQDLAGWGDGHSRVVSYNWGFGARGREELRIADCDDAVEAGSGGFSPSGGGPSGCGFEVGCYGF